LSICRYTAGVEAHRGKVRAEVEPLAVATRGQLEEAKATVLRCGPARKRRGDCGTFAPWPERGFETTPNG
jgi:hypothetical protein